MDEINNGAGNTSWTNPNQMNQSNFMGKVPNSNGSFVLGIISLCVSIICCCVYGSFVGLILSVIGLVLGNKAISAYEENPDVYDEASYRRAKTGKVLNIIGLVVSIIVSILLVIYVYLALTHQLPPAMQEEVDKTLRQYNWD